MYVGTGDDSYIRLLKEGEAGGEVIRVPFLYLSNLDLSQPHPLGAFFSDWAGQAFVELTAQDDPEENGTWALPADPNGLLVRADVQTLDPANLSKPVAFLGVVLGENFIVSPLEFFVTLGELSEPQLAHRSGTAMYADRSIHASELTDGV